VFDAGRSTFCDGAADLSLSGLTTSLLLAGCAEFRSDLTERSLLAGAFSLFV
jgi:hypothetical protein